MHGKFVLYSMFVGILFTLMFLPTSAQAAEEFKLMSALVGKGGNIWLPSTIIVSKGGEVTLILKNLAGKDHGFTIEELNIKEIIKPGESKKITIKPGKAGVLRYYCQLHKGHVGGQLLVK